MKTQVQNKLIIMIVPPSIVFNEGSLLYHKKFNIIEIGGIKYRNNEALLAPK